MAKRDNGGWARDRSRPTRSISPLYQRLPRGPHQLGAQEVARHQRLRMHGAMVEAVATNGYAGTSVKRVIGLAGVSRRAFYEQFANKEQCFLATFDLIVARTVNRVTDAYRSCDGDLEHRVTAAVEGFTAEIDANPKGAELAIVQSQTASMPGIARLRRATGSFEQMLAGSFARSPEVGPLPAPIVRGIVGGVHEATATLLRADRSMQASTLNGEIVDWTSLFHPSAPERLSEQLADRVRASSMSGSHTRLVGQPGAYDLPSGHPSWDARRPRTEPDAWSDRRVPEEPGRGNPRRAASWMPTHERLRLSVLNLSVIDDYHELSPPQIAEEAGVSIEAFCDLFASKQECFLAAFDDLSDELLRIAADPGLVSEDWAPAVRRVMRELMSLLAARPLYARIIACEAPNACPEAFERDRDLAHGIATLLTEGAPRSAQNTLTVAGVAGAIWHTIRCQVTSGQIQLLPALSDYLSYIVLTPFIGADAAAEVVIEDQAELAA